MFYTVNYKLPGQWFWRKLKQVKGDGFIPEQQVRFFILSDESRIEIPIKAVFSFCKGRFGVIKASMEDEAGTSIKTKA